MADYQNRRRIDDEKSDGGNSNEKRWGTRNASEGPQIILEPEHPLMRRFQVAYKECLEKENERLYAEILDLRENLKIRKNEYERQMGQEMYHIEQEVSSQRKLISEYETKLENSIKMRYKYELNLKRSRDDYKIQMEKLDADKKKDVEMLSDLEALTLLCKQYETWQKETDSELLINQRISEKLSSEKKILSEEKKKMDILVYKITSEVWNLEKKIELLEDQIKIKTAEVEMIKNKSCDSNTDLEALQMEQNQLMKLWNTVIINIQKRDKIFSEVSENVEKAKKEIQAIVIKIEGFKKDLDHEMLRGEQLTSRKSMVNYELAEKNKEYEKEEEKKSNLETSIMEISAMIELHEKDLHLAKNENIDLLNKIKSQSLQMEKINDEKIRLENETLDKLRERLNFDKTAENIANKIKQMKDISRKEEINVLKNENRYAKMLFKIEKQKVRNFDQSLLVDEEMKICRQRETELTTLENNLKEVLLSIDRKQNSIDILNRKLSSLIEKMEGEEISPIERQINELERLAEEKSMKVKQLQQDWLRLEHHCIQLDKQYSKLLLDNNLLKEQIQILEIKKAKLENIINTQKQEAVELQRTLDGLQYRIDLLTKQAHQDKELNVELEAKYNSLTFEFTAALKNAEMQAIMAEEEIMELEDEKKQLANTLQALKREVLTWQKMGMMAMETKENVNRDRSSGEIGKMKTEIHRMQVRKGQVMSTASRLAADLAQAVGRRAAAASRARACSKSSAPRHTFLTRIKEKRNEIRRLNQEIQSSKSAIESCQSERETLQKCIEEKSAYLTDIENEVEELRKYIEDSQLLKQKNLEMIIRYQRYGQHCSSILCGKSRVQTLKAEATINNEYEKQLKINGQLVSTVNKLLKDVPEQGLSLTKILNTLNVDEFLQVQKNSTAEYE